MILIWAPVCVALTYLGSAYVVGIFLRWRRSYSLSWPSSISPRKQAAACKLFLSRHEITAKYPLNSSTKHDLGISHAGQAILLCFGNTSTPQTRALFQDLSEFRQFNYPRGNCLIIVFFEDLRSRAIFDWSREFMIPILRPAQLGQLVALMKSSSTNLKDAVFEISAAAMFANREDMPQLGTFFEELRRGNVEPQ